MLLTSPSAHNGSNANAPVGCVQIKSQTKVLAWCYNPPVPLPAAEARAVAELVAYVRARFDTRLREIGLFGSFARGEAHEESDVDVLVVVDDLTFLEGREVTHFCGDLLTKHDVLVSPFVVSTAHMEHLRARERLIAREIDRDRVAL